MCILRWGWACNYTEHWHWRGQRRLHFCGRFLYAIVRGFEFRKQFI
jgi:hypothetical protein